MVQQVNLYLFCKTLKYSYRREVFCVDIINLERLISISYVDTFKFEDQCLLKLPRQDMTNMGYESVTQLTPRYPNAPIKIC